MIRLTYSNRTEALLDAFAEDLAARRAAGADPLVPTRIVVPNRNVERYLELGLAMRLGVASNLRFLRLSGLLREWLGERLLVGDAVLARAFRALGDPDLMREPVMAPLARYLSAAGDEAAGARRAQLAAHVAHLLEEYGYSRPRLLEAWGAGDAPLSSSPHADIEAWQRRLYGWMRERFGGLVTLREALRAAPPAPYDVCVFGLSYVARAFTEVYARLGDGGELALYTLNPCEEFWDDLETRRELLRREREGGASLEWRTDQPSALAIDEASEAPLLRFYGRPGREHVRLLGELTDFDFTARFVDPLSDPGMDDPVGKDLPLFAGLEAPPLLHRLQHDVLHRNPISPEGRRAPRDGSVVLLECPSLRREVETVAAEIWHAIETIEGLTFDRIAVLVNGPDRETYLPHLAAVFERAQAIPFSVTDLSLTSASPIAEAALGLLELGTSAFSRRDVLATMTHAQVRPPDVDPEEWIDLADRLGIVRGIDERAHEGTYLEGQPFLHWSQGLGRLALGAYMEEQPAPVRLGDRALLVEPRRGDGLAEAAFARLARSLMSDVEHARTSHMTLTEWSAFFVAMVRSYVRADSDAESAILARVLSVLGRLGELDLDGERVELGAALELVRPGLADLSASRGQPLANGVAISSLLPMRAIPFRVVFVLGLGEGRFPASDRRDSMDLRGLSREAGDVSSSERDRYTFLETLLCTREKLVLSYVARDERTGEPAAPSIVVTELLEVIDAGYLENPGERLVRKVPLRREDDPELGAILGEVGEERRARALGLARAEALGDDARVSGTLVGRTAREAARGRSELEARLGLFALPEPIVPGGEATLRLSVAALRRFLECPLQGWTRAVLGLEESETDSALVRSEEPFAPSRLDLAIALRGAFTLAALGTRSLDDAYRAEVEVLKARGRWPLGALARTQAVTDGEVLARWWSAWQALGPASSVQRVRFGAADRPDAHEEVLAPIELVFERDPRPGAPEGPLRVELVGRSELLRTERSSDASRASVTLHAIERRGERGTIDVRRSTLNAFFDHALLSAIGRGGPHEAIQLFGDREDARAGRHRFSPLPADAATSWLSGLVRQLLGGPHAYLLPIEAVLRAARAGRAMNGGALVESARFVRDRWDGGRSRWGPVPDPLSYPIPAPHEAEQMVRARFAPFLDASDGEPPEEDR
ncbi:MAG: exodeoxyribonuclease V subunit gamma [Sandaracinaceae bacterium]